MKTSELTGVALDWAVCVAEYGYGADFKTNRYSTNWEQGGPIIEREKINTYHMRDGTWQANLDYGMSDEGIYSGSTPLIAAMRCFVASKLGDEVEIPKELA